MKAQVLVADDSATIQKVVELTLSRAGVELIQARSGKEALQKARDLKPDLMLIDHSMPDQSGQELCAEVRQDPGLKDVPIILMAAALEPVDEAAIRGAGASDVVTKPFESQTLIDKVKQLLLAPIAPAVTAQPSMAPFPGDEMVVGAETLTGETSFALDAPEELGEDIKLPAGVAEEPVLEVVTQDTQDTLEESVSTYDVSTTETEELPLEEAVGGADIGKMGIEDMATAVGIGTSPAQVREERPVEPMPGPQRGREAQAAPVGAESLAVSPDMVETLAREVAERVATRLVDELKGELLDRVDRLLWEVVPDLAEQLLTQEIQRIRDLVEGKQ
ncbi:MAG: response regulator [candidate division NC10 bacterium]